MSHSFKSNEHTFISNSDSSGTITIINSSGIQIEVSGYALLAFAAEYIRRRRIAELETATDAELLGLRMS